MSYIPSGSCLRDKNNELFIQKTETEIELFK